jgi:molybdate transport system substrate-binding protein
MRRQRTILTLIAVLACSAAIGAEPASRPVTVFAAASLTSALGKLGDDYTKATGVPVRFSFAGSSTLARQIEAGAGADVFFSADQEWMNYLEQRGRIKKSSRHDVLGNRLALIAPADSKIELKIAPGFPLARALGSGRLATGDPDSVPVGRYARQALTSLGVWNDVAHRLVRAEDVRHALVFVAQGEVPLGIVYETDARVEKRVRLVGLFPSESHLPITYPVALTSEASPEAARFVEFVRSDAGRSAFEAFGFTVLR